MAEYVPSVSPAGATSTLRGNIDKAISLSKNKKYEEALAEFEAVLKSEPALPQAHMGAGNIKFGKKEYDAALIHYKEVMKLEPLKHQAYLRAARTYSIQGDLDEAVDCYSNAIKINPKLTNAYVGAGQALMRKEAYEEALDQFTKALRLNPRMVSVRQRIASVLLRQEKYSEALDQLQSALRLDAKNSNTHILMGRIYLAQSEYPKATKSFEEAIKLNPSMSATAKLGLAEGLIQVKRINEAKETLSEIPARDQSRAIYHKLWGDIYQKEGLFKEATEEYQAAKLLSSKEGINHEELDAMEFPDDNDKGQWKELAESFEKSTSEAMANRRARPSS